jgi:hypothetical protein
MALLDDEELLPFFGNPNIQRQGARARALAAQRDVNTLPDPRTYAALSGLLGTAPDQMGFSVLNPQYESIMQTARPAFYTGTALGVAPLARVFQAPAMALGRAGERMAERVVPQIMERGGLPAGLLQDMAQGSKSFAVVPAFHGTNAARIAEPKSKLSEMVDRTHFPGWFSEKPELANYYAIARGEGNPNVLPVNLDIKKPLSLNFDMNDKADAAYEAVKKLGLDPDFYPELRNKNWAHEVINTYTFKKAAQEAGYDAIKVLEDGGITYAPLKESGKQIKSRFQK